MNTAMELAQTELFADLNSDQIASFAAIACENKFESGQVVYNSDAAGDALYVIIEGTFVVRVIDENGDEVDVTVLKKGSYFGEMEVIGGMNRTAAIVADSPGRCYRFEAASLLALLKRDNALAAHFYRKVARELVRRLRNTTRDMGYFKVRANQ
ncbi:MAG: cyclic nucleotide-binding domain-containing protein [Deltaproteobacteria bacterium]|nr:cyclic nucleotide-binding domain-containing protein [Deltaproteobacteria bacterium]